MHITYVIYYISFPAVSGQIAIPVTLNFLKQNMLSTLSGVCKVFK